MGRAHLVLVVVLAALPAFGLSLGCGTGPDTSPTSAASLIATTSTVTAVATESTVDATSTTTTKEPTIVMTSWSTVDFIHIYYNLNQLIESDLTELIIKGRVVAYRDVFLHGQMAFRVLEVEVQKSFKGESSSKITVYDEGGIIPLKDALALVGAHFDPSALSEQQLENAAIDFRGVEGAEHLKVGDTVVMFLCRNSNKVPEDVSYMMVMSAYARYTLDPATGQYVRPDFGGPGFETRVSASEMEARLAQELDR